MLALDLPHLVERDNIRIAKVDNHVWAKLGQNQRCWRAVRCWDSSDLLLFFFFVTLSSLELTDTTIYSLKCELASEPLHISAK